MDYSCAEGGGDVGEEEVVWDGGEGCEKVDGKAVVEDGTAGFNNENNVGMVRRDLGVLEGVERGMVRGSGGGAEGVEVVDARNDEEDYDGSYAAVLEPLATGLWTVGWELSCGGWRGVP